MFDNNLIPPEQHGFLKGRSVTSNLIGALEIITTLAEKSVPADTICFDFRKAFDKVLRSILLSKLKKLNCPEFLISWITSFLSDRSMSVLIGNCKSSPVPTPSGVPQGSVLGPTLFLVMIADLPSFCQTDGVHCFLFADDVKIVGSDPACLQSFIDKLVVWSRENCLPIAPDKCSVTHFLPHLNPKQQYFFDGTAIPSTSGPVRDLGVMVSSDLSWDEHIKVCTRKAYSALYCLLKAIKSNNPTVLTRLYTVYVRPLLEFASPVFNPTLKRQAKELEKIQKLATRRIFFRSPLLRNYLSSFHYSDRLKVLNLESLSARRKRFDLKYFHQALVGLTPRNFEINVRKSITRGSSMKVFVPGYKSKYKRSFFSYRAARFFTKLPRSVQSISKHKAFVASLLV
uniref:Reverse transcriptase domain-containing protein n=2 Tax=Panagrellus redivivus TaxID=6233 RepID=A0A7E4V8T5_PANRE